MNFGIPFNTKNIIIKAFILFKSNGTIEKCFKTFLTNQNLKNQSSILSVTLLKC